MNHAPFAMNLKKHLKNFGLNPADWTLLPASRQTYLVVHRKSRNLKLLGQVTRPSKGGTWRSLTLLSI